MSTITTPVEDIAAIIGKGEPQPPQKCHTIDRRGWALCGAFGPGGREGGIHSRTQCRAQGHRHCVLCDELNRQLGDDGIVVRDGDPSDASPGRRPPDLHRASG